MGEGDDVIVDAVATETGSTAAMFVGLRNC